MRRMFTMLGLLVALMFVSPIFAGVDLATTEGCEDPSMVVHFDLNACDAVVGSTNIDYSEMLASYPETTNCGYFQVEGGHLYRENPTINSHSCTPGLNGTEAMCVSSVDDCEFIPYHEKAVRFDVTLSPIDGEVTSLTGLNFYEKAPEMFEWVDGASGPNNYPEKYGLRVTVDSVQIYRREDIQTRRDWNLETFDFSSNPNFSVTTTTTFHFELLPYCTYDNDSPVNAWDLEDIKILSCCNSCHAEPSVISTNDETSICINDQDPSGFSISLNGGFGEDGDFLLVDNQGTIIDIEKSSPITFNSSHTNVTSIYYAQYDDGFGPLNIGENIFNTDGCFELSNAIPVNIFWLNTQQIYTNSKTDICTSQQGDYIVNVENNLNTSFSDAYVITDLNGTIIELSNGSSLNFNNYDLGTYFIYYVLFDDLDGLQVGNSIFDLLGCFDISNSIEVNIKALNPTAISIDESSFCQGETNVLVANSSGAGVSESVFLILDQFGNIVRVSNSNNININNIGTGNYQVVEVLFESIQGLSVGNSINDLDGCFAISNEVDFEITAPDAGTITTNDPTYYCSTDNTASINVSLVNSTAQSNQWLVTDVQGNILLLPANSPINLDLLAGIATYQIWNLGYDGSITGLNIGQNINNINACYDLSNPISVSVDCVDGGSISTDSETDICLTGTSVSFDIDKQNDKGNNQTYVITDEFGNVVFTSHNDSFDYVLTGSGTNYEIWNVSYGENTQEISTGENISDFTGCFDTSNPIPFTVNCVDGGVISTDSPTELCSTDGDATIDVTVDDSKGDNGQLLVTDATGEIILVTDDYSLLIPTTGSGSSYAIYYVSYTDETEGLSEGNDLSDINGCFDLSNGIDVNVHCVNGGEISTNSETVLCSSDLTASFDIELNNQKGENQQFVVADENGNIISIQDQADVNFALTGSGTSYGIYSISYSDGLNGLAEGENINDVDGCFDWSNPISVAVNCVEGGTISTDSPTNLCGNDTFASLDIDLVNEKGEEQLFVVTNHLGEIVYTSESENVNFALTGSGTSYDIWSVSYTEGTTGLMTGQQVSDVEGCFDLSNPINIDVNHVNGGMISTDSPTEICGNEAVSQFDINLAGNQGDNTVFVITDEFGNIVYTSTNSSLNVSLTGSGTSYDIWSVAYTDESASLNEGDNINQLTTCYDLSNPIPVSINNVDGGIISTSSPTELCANDGPATFDLSLSGGVGEQLFIVTNSLGEIIASSTNSTVSISNVESHSGLEIWSIGYTIDTEGINEGANIANITGCFDLSNAIPVTINSVDGGTISTNDNTIICSTEDYVSVNVDLVGDVGMYQHMVVIDENGIIIHVDSDNSLGFNVLEGITTYEILNVAHTSDIQDLAIGQSLADLSGCFDLSNAIIIEVNCVNGGNITTSDETTFCGMSSSMIVSLEITNNKGDNTVFLITDLNGNIIEISNDHSLDVGITAIENGLQLWSISYTDTTSISIGDNVNSLVGCFDISNPINVSLDNLSETSISTISSTVFCEENFGVLMINVQGVSGSNSSFVVVDANNNIVLISDSANVDLSSLSANNYSIYQLSYNDNLTGLSVGSSLTNLDGCFTLSNAINVKSSELDAGKLALENGDVETSICVGDCASDLINVNLTGDVSANGAWFITDENGVITSLSAGPPFDFENSDIGTCMIWYITYEDGFVGLNIGSHIFDFDGCFDLANSITVTKYGLGLSGNSYAHVDFDECHSHPDSLTNVDFSEFTADIHNEEGCANIDLVGGFVYRDNPSIYKHSCTPGVDDSPAMCVSSLEDCTYEADSDYAIRFSIALTPGLSGTALLSSISFYERAPETFDWINGTDGINNYPTKYGIRISVAGNEIYRQDELATSFDYTLESFDFAGLAAFEVNQTTVFDVELLGYCTIGNGAEVTAWDIDDLLIESGCNSKLYAGEWTMPQGNDIAICLSDELSNIVEFNTSHGPFDYQYIVTNEFGNIQYMLDGNSVDFGLLGEGTYQVYGVAHIGEVYPALGSPIDLLVADGCYAITETSISVSVIDVCPNSVIEPAQPDLDFSLSPNPTTDFLKIKINSAPNSLISIAIYNDLGQAVKQQTFNITDELEYLLDLRDLSAGMYVVKVRSADQDITKKIIKITR